MTRPSLTAAVLARDEAALLPDCLDSLSFADEVLVLVDAATGDPTRHIARERGARVEERVFDDFAGQRQAALDLARGQWVLFVDADERVLPELREEILAQLEHPDDHCGFWMPRFNYILGRLVLNAGWFPDEQLRLLRRDRSRYQPPRVVHEVAVLDGPAGHLEHPLLHLNYRSLVEFIRKQERYSRLEAQRWVATFGRPRARAIVGQPLREFWRRYVQLKGYREGVLGFVLCVLLAWYAGKSVWLARHATAALGSS